MSQRSAAVTGVAMAVSMAVGSQAVLAENAPADDQTTTSTSSKFRSSMPRPSQIGAANVPGESGANTLSLPGQILRTGIDLNATSVSSRSLQLADELKLTPVLQKIENLRGRVDESTTLENIAAKQSLALALQEAQEIIQEADLATDFTVAEINAEQQVYNELLSTWQAKANKRVQYSNWASYYSNGALWAVAEALDIPTWKRPKYAISSGTIGIIAGMVPSVFSVYGMHAANGSKYPGEGVPNMLAKVFNLPGNIEVDYPRPVWEFLSATPPSEAKSRRDQLIDRWVSDSNIPAFTDRSSKSQIETIAGIATDKKILTISVMQTRLVMLSQLAAEILKMKRLLYELSMTVHGEKRLQVADTPGAGVH